jgi:hypothetical protein
MIDPPDTLADDFYDFYNPLVFGDGTVSVVINSVQIANSVGGCMSEAAKLVGLEVNQAIQDWKNSVQLIEDKTTYVRAHIEPAGSDTTKVFGFLHGERNDHSLPGSPLSPVNVDGMIFAYPNAASRRGSWDSSLNFRLPDTWLQGTIELRIETVGSGLSCHEPAETGGKKNDCKVRITFNKTDTLEVKFITIDWIDGGGKIHQFREGDEIELIQRLKAIYPIASGDTGLDWFVDYLMWDGTGRPDFSEINPKLEIMRIKDRCLEPSCNKLYYGVIKDDKGGGRANAIPGTVASGAMRENNFTKGRYTHAHELGHDLGRHHAVHSSVEGTPAGKKYGWCGEVAGAAAPDFPYNASKGSGRVATIGPMNSGENSLIYGLDTYLLDQNERSRAVIDPVDHYELMSYCGGSWRWISDFTYEGLASSINNTFSAESLDHDAGFLEEGDSLQDYLIVRGMISRYEDTLEFLPFGSLSSPAAPPQMPTGEYTLKLFDDTQVKHSISFEPNWYENDFPTEDTGVGSFIIPVVADPSIVKAEVLHNSTSLGTLNASANPPSVAVTYPNGGENLSGDSVNLQWSASDGDSDPLTFDVQYSHDNGSSWKTLDVDLTGKSYSIPLSRLAGTDEGLFQVAVSDGFHSVTDQSDGAFSTPNNSPHVFMISPADRQIFVGAQIIPFRAEYFDREDLHSYSSIQWKSDFDGVLGDGHLLDLSAVELSEGKHKITVKATDSDGASVKTSITLYIYRVANFSYLYLPTVFRK